MKKKIAAIAIVLAAFVSFNVSAQSVPDAAATAAAAKCPKAGNCKKMEKKCANPFAGLNLTDAQKQALKDLKTDRCKKKDVCKEKCKADSVKKCCRAEKMAKDKNARTEYLSKVKAILTPEQYVQFLENSFVLCPMGKHKTGFHKNRR